MTYDIASILTWLLIAFFTIGGVINAIAPKAVREEYARWGYPGWFHYVTAGAELLTAVLLLFPVTRVLGAVVGFAVMAAAIATVLRHREYTHAITPVVVLLLTTGCGLLVFNAA